MEVTINYNGQAVAVEVTLEVYEFLDRADHKAENLSHEQRRHWDGREFDEYIVATEGVGIYGETPEDYLCLLYTSKSKELADCTRFFIWHKKASFRATENTRRVLHFRWHRDII